MINRQDSRSQSEQEVRFKADRRVFLPVAVIAVLYGVLWLALLAIGRGDTALARALLLVVVIAVPVLLARAWMRFVSLELRVSPERLAYRDRWLRPEWREVALVSVTGVRTVYGPAGRALGGGALIISLDDGSRIRLADIADLEEAARRINGSLRGNTAPRTEATRM
jgi:hypothetical protein